MSSFRASISPIKCMREPNTKEMEAMDTYVAEYPEIITSKNFKWFVERVASKGHTFYTATFKNGVKSRDTYEQSKLLVLYFDTYSSGNRNLTFREIKARAEKYNLPILFAYDSFSPIVARKKFVVVFLNDTPFKDIREAEAVLAALKIIFPESDKDTSPLKLYPGGNKLIYANYSMPELNVYSLFMNMSLWLKRRYGDTNYKRRYLTEFSKETGISLNSSNFPDVSVTEVQTESYRKENNDTDISEDLSSTETIYSRKSEVTTDDKNLTKCIIEGRSVKKLSQLSYRINFDNSSPTSNEPSAIQPLLQKNFSSYRSKELQNLSSYCKLYQDFQSGERILSENELLGLSTNIVQIRGGAARFKNTLSENPYFSDDREKFNAWEFYLSYIKDGGPRPCDSFCLYHNTCPHGRNILSTLKPFKHQIEKIANWGESLVSIDEAWDDFKLKFDRAVRSKELIWHIIKSQTALGKTQAVLELMKDTHLRILIVVPTNKLKREICERAKKMGINLVASPSLHELKDDLPDHAWSAIQSLYDAGKSPMPYLLKAIEENDAECSKLFQQYIKELSAFEHADGHAITTHRRLTNLDVSKYDLVIVDEDVLYSTVIPNRETISISDLKKINKRLPANDPLAIKIKKILKKRKLSRYFTLSEVSYSNTHTDIEVAANIPALCAAKYFCYRSTSDYEENLTEDSVTFIKPVQFQSNIKYIMLSATADRDICEYYFGSENMRFYTCKEAEIEGTLNLYGDRPWGRSSIRKDTGLFGRINKWTGSKHTISFKEFHDYYEGDSHFGNCVGCDTKKGENIDVIGTPHQPWWIYELYAYSLGFDVDESPKPNATVTRNGFRFPFYTYNDPTLQNIQFYMIQSELEQAVGRARLLRFDCTVNLFSDFPLRQAILLEFEYDKQ